MVNAEWNRGKTMSEYDALQWRIMEKIVQVSLIESSWDLRIWSMMSEDELWEQRKSWVIDSAGRRIVSPNENWRETLV